MSQVEKFDSKTFAENELLVQALVEYEQKAAGYYEFKNRPLKFGIRNFNNTCFIGSTVLSFLNQIGTRNLLLEIGANHLDELNQRPDDVPFLRTLIKLLAAQLRGNRENAAEASKRLMMRTFLGMKQFQAGTQGDAHEFLHALFNAMEKEILALPGQNNIQYLTKFRHTWTLHLKEKFTCQNNHVNERIEDSMGLHVHLGQFKTLEDTLEDYFAYNWTKNDESLGCSVCQDAVLGTRYRDVLNTPPTLVLYLNRFFVRPAKVSINAFCHFQYTL